MQHQALLQGLELQPGALLHCGKLDSMHVSCDDGLACVTVPSVILHQLVLDGGQGQAPLARAACCDDHFTPGCCGLHIA